MWHLPSATLASGMTLPAETFDELTNSGVQPVKSSTPSEPFDPTASTLIDGRYKVVRRLGAGAMGVVYQVEDVLLARPAAIKLIDPSLATTPEAEKSLLREARALARLRHSNVVQAYAFGSFSDRLFFAMEYVDGESLEDIIVRLAETGDRLPLEEALSIVTSVAAGLSEAHAHEIVHRDVKPSNIVIERGTGRPVLIDFGIARELTGSVRSSFVVAGTPSYMAPEQAIHDRSLFSHKIDLYALACMAFELVTGHPVFDEQDAYAMLHAHISKTAPKLSSVRPEYAGLDAVFARALAKEPRDRYESCDAFAADLARVARRTGLLRTEEPREAETPSAKRRLLALVAEDGVRRAVVSTALREKTAGPTAGPAFQVECETDPGRLLAAFADAGAAIVVLDDDVAAGASIAIARRLRALAERAGGRAPHVLVMTRNILDRDPEWQALGVRRLSKPVNPRALATTFDEIEAALGQPSTP